MLRSMTGFGSGTRAGETASVTVELKSVNGRFLKLSLRSSMPLGSREADLEKLCRAHLVRGSVTAAVRVTPSDPARLVSVNEEVVVAYQARFRELGLAEERIPTLPGVLESEQRPLSDGEWELVEGAATDALRALVSMREREGSALKSVLAGLLDSVAEAGSTIAARAPEVLIEYRDKLTGRVGRLLADSEVAVAEEHLAREIALFADRSDITEELDRLGAHLDQAREFLGKGGEVGRKLEFLAQEMHREINTVGSKASDTAIAQRVVAAKADIEKLKEQLANVE